MECAIATDIGFLREENQDIVRAEKFADNVLAVVCDGMGGERAGLEASQRAMSVFFDEFQRGYKDNFEKEDVRKLLLQSVSAANQVVYALSKMNYKNYGMGTTLVAAFVSESHVSIVNVGDSRAYYYDNNELYQLTNDHTLVNMLYEKGKISYEEAEHHPQKHMLTKAVGVDRYVEPDYFCADRSGTSKILLCSDGLSSYSDDSEICAILSQNERTDELVKQLMELALSKGGRDNISVAVILEREPDWED